MGRCNARLYVKYAKQRIKALSKDLSQGMSDKLEDCHWMTAVIITGVKEVGKAWNLIILFYFNLAWNLTTDSQKEMG